MSLENKIKASLKEKIREEGLKSILLIDGDDLRAQSVARQIIKQGLGSVTLLVDSMPENVPKDLEFVAIDSQDFVDSLIQDYLKIRTKETEEEAKKALLFRPNFAALLVRMGHYDCALGGLGFPTADILRAGFRLIGPKPGIKTISSCMLMSKEEQLYIFSDVSVVPQPTAEQLSDIGLNAVAFAKVVGLSPKVAFLSFSTLGSAVSSQTQLVSQAHQLFREKSDNKYLSAGEIQFDAAFDMQIRASKYKEISFRGTANVYVFPDLNSGNIGYKIAQRLGGFLAIGPVVTGIRLPFNDLSRGATVEDVFFTALLTLLDSY